jgi:hypothetical protein
MELMFLGIKVESDSIIREIIVTLFFLYGYNINYKVFQLQIE